MNLRHFALFCSVFTTFVCQAAYADKEEASEEITEEQYNNSEVDVNGTMDVGPPDSHEAMNNRGDYKPKFTSSPAASVGGASNREKRSYEFLLGLVNNNSRFQVTNTDEDGVDEGPQTVIRRNKVTSNDLGASELLLELLVKIAAHPDHWEQVHNLLQKIDRDLKTSKKILKDMQTAKMPQKDNIPHPVLQMKKKQDTPTTDITKEVIPTDNRENKTSPFPPTNNTFKNSTKEALKTNQWSYQSSQTNEKIEVTTKYPWEVPPKSIKNDKYPRNFAYHRVTGNPVQPYHPNMNNNPKAYIAVSVIAPKPMDDRHPDDDLLLENELRELKPWTHNQNLKNMASLRSRWVIQSEKKKQQQQYLP